MHLGRTKQTNESRGDFLQCCWVPPPKKSLGGNEGIIIPLSRCHQSCGKKRRRRRRRKTFPSWLLGGRGGAGREGGGQTWWSSHFSRTPSRTREKRRELRLHPLSGHGVMPITLRREEAEGDRGEAEEACLMLVGAREAEAILGPGPERGATSKTEIARTRRSFFSLRRL